ncbi:MAG TPA: hypothetical protein VI278_10950 [Nitrososphaeraceae archaeon]
MAEFPVTVIGNSTGGGPRQRLKLIPVHIMVITKVPVADCVNQI